MNILAYALKRFGSLLLVLLVTSFLVFGLLYLAPGTPLSFLLGPRGGTPEQIAAVTAKYHLDEPFLARYAAWLGDVLHGDFGQSIVYRQDVSDMIGGRIGTTVMLVAIAAVVIAVVGIAVGTYAALKGGSIGSSISSLASVALSTPVFVIGVALISVFAVALGWFPVFGSGSGGLDTLYHLTLPAIALSVGSAAYLIRITRASVDEERGREHVEEVRLIGIVGRDPRCEGRDHDDDAEHDGCGEPGRAEAIGEAGPAHLRAEGRQGGGGEHGLAHAVLPRAMRGSMTL